MTLTEAKQTLRIPELWRLFNLSGDPSKSCRSPFRDDRNPSFSVYKDGLEWKDFSTGEAGDAVDFLARIRGYSKEEKVARFIERAAEKYGLYSSAIRWPEDLRGPSVEECEELGRLRNLSPAAFHVAGVLGTLKTGTVFGERCWVLLDEKRVVAEARRFDGRNFAACGALGERKTHTLKGSVKNWPVGLTTFLRQVNAVRNILLVEGSADYFAALEILANHTRANYLPAAILGRTQSISHDALQVLNGRRIVIIPHSDSDGGGRSAAIEWARTLSDTIQCEVTIEPLPKIAGVKDLNDFLRVVQDESLIQKFSDEILS